MPNINMESILKKAKLCVNAPEYKQKIDSKLNEHMLSSKTGNSNGSPMRTPAKAAETFISILKHEIESLEAISGYADGKLGLTAVNALTKLSYGIPHKIGENTYKIDIWFDEDLHRDSLDTRHFTDGIDNIAALLNKGYDAKNTVYGVWSGHSDNNQIPSIAHRKGACFIDNSIENFMREYADVYRVIDIRKDNIYE